jgi:hypothetical protein
MDKMDRHKAIWIFCTTDDSIHASCIVKLLVAHLVIIKTNDSFCYYHPQSVSRFPVLLHVMTSAARTHKHTQ